MMRLCLGIVGIFPWIVGILAVCGSGNPNPPSSYSTAKVALSTPPKLEEETTIFNLRHTKGQKAREGCDLRGFLRQIERNSGKHAGKIIPNREMH